MPSQYNKNMKLEEKIQELKKFIGKTPLINIKYRYKGKIANIQCKAEWMNPSGSIKDRPALFMLESAILKGELQEGQAICETTSGNMGLSLAWIANYLGIETIICMPKFMSKERKKLLSMYGASLVLTDSFEDAFDKAREFGRKGAFLPLQFENKVNIFAHENTTAKEIEKQTLAFPAFISGVGTGGTLTGIGGYLKEKYGTKVIALEPYESKLLSQNDLTGKHKIQGLADHIVPENYHADIVDEIVSVKSDDAICMAQKLAYDLGLGVGISSGANFLACVLSGIDNVITLFPDDNKKYLSTDLAKPMSSKLVDEIELLSFSINR